MNFFPKGWEKVQKVLKLRELLSTACKLVWPIPTSQAPVKVIFSSHWLECNHPFHMFLTPRFSPQLQVSHKLSVFVYMSHNILK